VAFTPLFILGLMGATRRLDTYESITGWQPLFIIALIGFGIITSGVITQIYQLIVSVRERKNNLDVTGDPWNGRTLEWSTPSPPPFYNFSQIPNVEGFDAFWLIKNRGEEPKKYEDIEMPKPTAMGIYISGFSFLAGFGIVWHITWLIALGIIGVVACIIRISFDEHTEYILPASKVAEIENKRRL
jgi:cytochrome o ubiquinol oxidase subunit I